jgi:DNA-binding SARP family transcriptional activator
VLSHAIDAGLPERTVALQLFGAFRLEVGGAPVPVPHGTQRLVALLALRQRLSRHRIAGTMWPNAAQTQALTNLRHSMWRLQRVAPVGLVVDDGNELALAPEVECDVSFVIRVAGHELAGDDVPRCMGLLRVDAAEILPDWDVPWISGDRERLRQLRLQVLEGWVDQLVAQRRFGMALRVALTARQDDPLRESAHRAVIQVHLAQGNVAEARRALATCGGILWSQLGVGPAPETQALLPASAGMRSRRALRADVRSGPVTSARDKARSFHSLPPLPYR